MNKKYIKRDLFYALKEHMSHREITLLVGPRQAGKTTLLKILEEELHKDGHKTLFLNLDMEKDRQFFVSQEALVQHIRFSIGEGYGFVFIDEAQRQENAGRFFKGIYDMNLPYKFVISGSGGLELKEDIQESMAGRKRMFELLPVSFREFAAFRTDYAFEGRMPQFLAEDRIRTSSLLDEYLRFGGYPGVILASSSTEKRDVLNEIYQSYLVRDISFLLGVEKTDAFTNLVRLLSSQIGNLVSVSELSSTLGISAPTVKHYLWYLEHTFIAHRLNPYFRNARKEVAKMPVYYFYDLGLRNFAAQFSPDAPISDGFIFENFVFTLLYSARPNTPGALHFWRSKGGAEVDFIIDSGRGPIPCEIKYTQAKALAVGRSLRSFIAQYRPREAFVITPSTESKISINGTVVHVIPFYRLLDKKF